MLKSRFFSLQTAALAAVIVYSTACSPQTTHSNQMTPFDGTAYDSLVLIHGALGSLRGPVSAAHPEIVANYNQAVGAYTQAVTVYGLYRVNGSTAFNTTVALEAVDTALVTIFTQMENSLAASAHVQKARAKMRAQAARTFSTTELMNLLQLAATVAEATATSQGGANRAQMEMARMLLDASGQARGELQATAKAPIDLSKLSGLTAIE